MSPLLLKSARRFYLGHPWQLALAVAGIGLGVAVYVGVSVANDSARRAFEVSADVVRGRTTHRLLPVGDGLPETIYRDLVVAGRVTAAAPVIEATVRLDGPAGQPRTLLGIDPLKEARFRDFSSLLPGQGADLGRLMTGDDTVLIPEALAADRGLEAGSTLTLWIDGRRQPVSVIGTVDSAQAPGAVPIVADIATVQTLVGITGAISRIDLALDTDQAEALEAALPAGTVLVRAESETSAIDEMTRAFRTNLTALGLLALVVGLFLIYSTMSFSIVQRRPVIGILRAIGVERGFLLRHVLAEGLIIGVIGTLAGLALGHWLARGLVELVLRTIGDLYFSRAVASVSPSAWIYAQGAALGLGATLLAALGPALDASRSQPAATLRRAALERETRARCRQAAYLSIPVLVIAMILLILTRNLTVSFAGLFLVLCAGAMLTPALTVGLMRLLEKLFGAHLGLAAVMALRGVSASLSRTGVATAALAVSVATVVGIGLMIGSFRGSLMRWIDTTLTADLYVSVAGTDDGFALSDADVEAIGDVEGVRGLSLTRFVSLPGDRGEIAVRAHRPGPDGWGLDIVRGEPGDVAARLAGGDAVAVAEPTAYRAGLSLGDTVTLPTPDGDSAFDVVGVFRDYNTAGANYVMSLGTYRRHWGDERLSSIGVHLEPGADEAAVVAAIRRAAGSGDPLRFRSTAGIKRLSLTVFDRTFQITEVLRLLAGSVAFLGVLSAVLAIQLERAREIAVLASIGFSRRQLGVQTLTQTGLLGLAAGIAAVPLGIVLAALLVYVINRRSFGWSMDLAVDVQPLVLGLALAVGAALLAGVYPALQSGGRRLADAAHDD